MLSLNLHPLRRCEKRKHSWVAFRHVRFSCYEIICSGRSELLDLMYNYCLWQNISCGCFWHFATAFGSINSANLKMVGRNLEELEFGRFFFFFFLSCWPWHTHQSSCYWLITVSLFNEFSFIATDKTWHCTVWGCCEIPNQLFLPDMKIEQMSLYFHVKAQLFVLALKAFSPPCFSFPEMWYVIQILL